MLQVISGKFYKAGSEVTETAARGVIYSNTTYVLPIRTSVATLELANSDDGIGTYVMDYVSRFDQKPGRLRTLRMGDSTIVEQFRLLALFSFKAYFSTSRDQVAKTCHAVGGRRSRTNPASYVRSFFDPTVQIAPDNAERFRLFVDKVLGMPRNAYEKVLDCLSCFADAIELVGYNTDLAYSMLVYCAEALSQEFDNYTPVWSDVPEPTRNPLDAIFAQIPERSAQGIRAVLLEQQHLKLQQRFIRFLTDHLPQTFYTKDAAGLINPIRPSELKKMLVNAYGARSKFVHTLKAIRHQIKVPQIGDGEVFHTFGDPYLTFNGMVRLVHSELIEFIERQPVVVYEEFEWDRSLSEITPDVVELYPAPKYWIWQAASAVPEVAARRLTGFLSCILTNEMPNLNAVVERYIDLFPTVASDKQKLHMALLCEWYFSIFAHLPEVALLEKKYAPFYGILKRPSIHAMLYRLMECQKLDWPAEKAADLYLGYEKQRVDGEFSIPLVWELALILEVANQFFTSGNNDKCLEWKSKARLEAAGNQDLQNQIEGSLASRGRFHLNGLLELHLSEKQRDGVEEAAYYISLRRNASGEPGDSLSDWLEGEVQFLLQQVKEAKARTALKN